MQELVRHKQNIYRISLCLESLCADLFNYSDKIFIRISGNSFYRPVTEQKSGAIGRVLDYGIGDAMSEVSCKIISISGPSRDPWALRNGHPK